MVDRYKQRKFTNAVRVRKYSKAQETNKSSGLSCQGMSTSEAKDVGVLI